MINDFLKLSAENAEHRLAQVSPCEMTYDEKDKARETLPEKEILGIMVRQEQDTDTEYLLG